MRQRVWLREIFEFVFGAPRIADDPELSTFWGASLAADEYALAKPRKRIPIVTTVDSGTTSPEDARL